MDTVGFIALVAACAPLVDATTAQALVGVESSFNPHAIYACAMRGEQSWFQALTLRLV